MRFLALVLLGALQATTSFADGFAFPGKENYIGNSRLLTNDLIGDGKDRWRTGSYAVSLTFGQDVSNGLPYELGRVMEYRLRAEIVAPENLARRTPFPDRPYAGVLGLGGFTHFSRGRTNFALGAELVLVGPSTGLDGLQAGIHDALSVQLPVAALTQLGNDVYPTLHSEISREYFVGQNETLIRPFFTAEAGLETFARIGVDAVFGRGFQNNFFTRDPHTGFLVTNKKRHEIGGFGFVLGGDVAYIADSELLPDSLGYDVREFRPRVRAGVVYEGDNVDFFYGATWLGREFESQRESQVVGSIRLNIRF